MLTNTDKLLKQQTGQSLIELLIAMVIFIMVIASITFMTLDAQVADRQGEERTRATQLTYEGLDASKSIKNRGWKYLTIGQHGISDISGFWEFAGTENNIDQYQRRITVENVNRDDNKNIVATGGTIDFDTKKITSKVDWQFTPERPSDVTLASYLTNWKSKKWIQTTTAEFNGGTRPGGNVVVVPVDDGALQLNTASSASSKIWEFDQASDYNYDIDKIEVNFNNNNIARLIQITGPKSGATLNPTFDTDASWWTFSSWGTAGATGNHHTTGGNPGTGGYIDINVPKKAGSTIGGYWYQGFSVDVNNPTVANLKFDWKAINLTYANLIFPVTLYVFIDSVPGSPTVGTEIWKQEIDNMTPWTSPGDIDVRSKLTTAGTYYLKLAFRAVTPPKKPSGPFVIGYDNVLLQWEGYGTSYPTDQPTINPTASFSDSQVSSWSSFAPTANLEIGGQIFYQLSDNDGASWQFWNGSAWSIVVNPNDYNIASDINAHISTFPATNKKIMFKAFLSSNGVAQVNLDRVEIGYQESGYVTYGEFESSLFDTGSSTTIYNYITWSADVPVETTLKFQMRFRYKPQGGKWQYTPWFGPNETSNTYFQTPGETIPDFDFIPSVQQIQYKAYLDSPTGQNTPILKDITIDYEQ